VKKGKENERKKSYVNLKKKEEVRKKMTKR
jgi:hypothetical protein